MTMDSFSFVLFTGQNLTSSVQLEPMETGSSEELVLQVNNGSHGAVQLASGAPPAFWRFSGTAVEHLWRIAGAGLVHF